MRRDPIRFRAVLPIIFAFLAAMLMVWNYENDRVVTSMGIGWDMGPPFWPYQADYLALFAINAPAFVLSMPILRLLELQTLSLQDAIWFPAILALWWWIGTRIDFGVLGRRNLRYPKPLASLLTILSFVLLYIAARVGLDEVHWWTEYGRNSSPYRLPTLLRTAGPVLWCLALATGCLDAAIRLIQLRTTSAAGNRPNYRLLVVGAAAGVLYVFAIHRLDKFLNPPFNYDQCAVDRLYALGCIHGTVVDEGGKRISHIELDLIPALKTGDARWYGTHSEWTDEHGRYNFNRLEPSQYLLGANAFSASGAPNAERPFATAYYPASANESEAATLDVVRSSALQLAPLRLHKLGLAAIKITVRWSAGTRPQRSNIFFQEHSLCALRSDCTTDRQWHGRISLPKGFEYDAAASVECDAGKTIESRDSRPDQGIKVVDGFHSIRNDLCYSGTTLHALETKIANSPISFERNVAGTIIFLTMPVFRDTTRCTLRVSQKRTRSGSAA